MSLHSIIEPAGTLNTGWGLIDKDCPKPDIRNKAEEAKEPKEDEGARTPKKELVHHG